LGAGPLFQAQEKGDEMMKRVSTIVMAVLLSSLFAAAQAPEMPKPGQEQKNLGFMAGNWNVTGDVKPGPMGPGGKYTGVEHTEWMPGGYFLVSHTQGSSAMGKETGLAIYGYDPGKKVYTYDEFNSVGEAVHATGTFDGKVWTWSTDIPAGGGKSMKSHFIVTEVSPTSYTFKFEVSPDGTSWTTFMDGSGSKVAGTGEATKK
jgi:hypothetical protein